MSVSVLNLLLKALSVNEVIGIYDVDGDHVSHEMPARLRFLAPDAAAAWRKDMHDKVVISDMFRSPESSKRAVAEGRGAQPPSFSAHNYGLAVDLDIDDTMTHIGVKKKVDLDMWMRERGWYCHRVDHKMGHEAWHYNFLGDPLLVISPKVKSTAGYIEQEIRKRYASFWMNASSMHCQELLRQLKLYGGEIDGKIGPLSRQAIMAFQRTWDLLNLNDTYGVVQGHLDTTTVRCLTYVTHKVVLA